MVPYNIHFNVLKWLFWGTFLEVQWLRLCASTAGGTGSTPGRGTAIPHAVRHGQKKKKQRLFLGAGI